MGREARKRIERELGWPHQRQAYLEVYDTLTDPDRSARQAAAVRGLARLGRRVRTGT